MDAVKEENITLLKRLAVVNEEKDKITNKYINLLGMLEFIGMGDFINSLITE